MAEGRDVAFPSTIYKSYSDVKPVDLKRLLMVVLFIFLSVLNVIPNMVRVSGVLKLFTVEALLKAGFSILLAKSEGSPVLVLP